MRLLLVDERGEFKHRDFNEREVPPYAILSHTWDTLNENEVQFRDIEDGSYRRKDGFTKLEFCRDRIRDDGLEWFWIDTCCVDQQDVEAKKRALHSMYRWYSSAKTCYVYLSDVSLNRPEAAAGTEWHPTFSGCKWFGRGWTLQELLAPRIVEFYCKQGFYLGDKRSLQPLITDRTKIPPAALQGADLAHYSKKERLSWAEGRITTVEEDIVYCLVGIFGASLEPLYGEGIEKAMTRLNAAIKTFRTFSLASFGAEVRYAIRSRATIWRQDRNDTHDNTSTGTPSTKVFRRPSPEVAGSNERAFLSLAHNGGFSILQADHVDMLLRRGASLEAKDDEPTFRTPLIWAVCLGKKELVQIFLRHEAAIDAADGARDLSPVVWAILHNEFEILQSLIEKGANLSRRDRIFGRTPLLWAASVGSHRAVKLLLETENAYLIRQRSDGGASPLGLALYKGKCSTQLAELLLRYQDDLDFKFRHGTSLVGLALWKENEPVARLLLQKGADPHSTYRGRVSILRLAKHRNYQQVVEMLENSHASLSTQHTLSKTEETAVAHVPLSMATSMTEREHNSDKARLQENENIEITDWIDEIDKELHACIISIL